MEEKYSSGAEKAENLTNSESNNDNDACGRAEMRVERKKNELLAHERAMEERERENLLHESEENELKAQKQRNKELLMQIEKEEILRRKAERKNKRKTNGRPPAFAGWLTAVVCLSFAVLALGTTVIAGWFKLNEIYSDTSARYTQSLYELNAIMDNLDVNLAKAKIASSKGEQVRVLTDIVVQSETAETVLERLPVNDKNTAKFASFINKVNENAKMILYSVADGNALTQSQKASVDYMYQVAAEYKRAINETIAHSNEKSIGTLIQGGDNFIENDFESLNDISIQIPKSIQDGPFSENLNKTSTKDLNSLKDIAAPTAESIVEEKFASYNVKDVKCTGECIAANIECYNVCANSDVGEMLIQISKKGGKVVMFDGYRECTEKTFSTQRCTDIAQDFLKSLGYDNLKAVWCSEDGTVCNINFVYEQNGVAVYPDMIKVKVCETMGKVTGLEALPYVLNHEKRDIETPNVSFNMARSRLCENFEVENERLAIIPFEDKEILAYEFSGNFDGNEYYVYVDAATGEEIESFTVIQTKQGRNLL